jgi:hypothetical protein
MDIMEVTIPIDMATGADIESKSMEKFPNPGFDRKTGSRTGSLSPVIAERAKITAVGIRRRTVDIAVKTFFPPMNGSSREKNRDHDGKEHYGYIQDHPLTL